MTIDEHELAIEAETRRYLGFSLRPISKRIWTFTSEVLCQAKVIRERPLPGMAHAFVFWGFLAFALVSLNHFATGVRLGFLQHMGFVGTFYFAFAGIWAFITSRRRRRQLWPAPRTRRRHAACQEIQRPR